ncbi:type II toxin-antitoxin system VapC family toxin [Methylomonas sp. EFPC3]|uniref:type II toxin-antitoxin system VapC family toxin n=1 Tax=Methylomonas sp. EFPC3 TaxID=3021710 RepID=UPI002416DF7B|nr:type II toxin-antitoxin system VapC family toxin [Methylomonas sp. EFPC3]WFP49628.1 type II toxin-antitoxin system VapC family toxin [Methylomonas sp. EFPC3]
MNSHTARADFFDASALVKVYSDEPGSSVVRAYFHTRPTKYTTPFCFYEAMNVLKGKWKHKGLLTLDQYLEAAFRLTAWYGASSSRIKDLDFTDPLTFMDAKAVAERNKLDLSDAFQILSVKKGYFSVLVNESATVLVTGDKELAEAAKLEGLRPWNLMLEPAPE